MYHPLLFLDNNELISYIIAINKINNSDNTKFWLIAPKLDASISLNYYVYPKEVQSTVDTQMAWNRIALSLSDEDVPNDAPAIFEEIIRVLPSGDVQSEIPDPGEARE